MKNAGSFIFFIAMGILAGAAFPSRRLAPEIPVVKVLEEVLTLRDMEFLLGGLGKLPVEGSFPGKDALKQAVGAYVIWREAGKGKEESFVEGNRERFLRDLFWQVRVFEPVEVSESDVIEYYHSNPDSFYLGEWVRFRHMFFSPDLPGGPDSARSRSAEAFSLLREGIGFEEVAIRYSDSGNPGRILDIQIVFLGEAIRKALSSLELGEFSHPFETEFGIQIVQLAEPPSARYQPYEEVAESIRIDREMAEERNHSVRFLEELNAMFPVSHERIDSVPQNGEGTETVLARVGEVAIRHRDVLHFMGREGIPMATPIQPQIFRRALSNLTLHLQIMQEIDRTGFAETAMVQRAWQMLSAGLFGQARLEEMARERAEREESSEDVLRRFDWDILLNLPRPAIGGRRLILRPKGLPGMGMGQRTREILKAERILREVMEEGGHTLVSLRDKLEREGLEPEIEIIPLTTEPGALFAEAVRGLDVGGFSEMVRRPEWVGFYVLDERTVIEPEPFETRREVVEAAWEQANRLRARNDILREIMVSDGIEWLISME